MQPSYSSLRSSLQCFSEQFGPHSHLVTTVLASHGTLGEMSYVEFRSLYLKSLLAGNVDEIMRDFNAHAPPPLPSPEPSPAQPPSVNIWDECELYDNDQASSMDGER